MNFGVNFGLKAWLAAGIAAAGFLWRFPPEQYAFYPRCPVYETFGFLCPGCGATHAASALLHGRVLEALHWNALFVVALTVLVLYALTAELQREGRGSHPSSWVVGSCVTVALLFGVARNL